MDDSIKNTFYGEFIRQEIIGKQGESAPCPGFRDVMVRFHLSYTLPPFYGKFTIHVFLCSKKLGDVLFKIERLMRQINYEKLTRKIDFYPIQ